MIFRLASLLLQLALKVFQYLERRQLLKQAQKETLNELREAANELIDNAQRAADNVTDDERAILGDPNNRSNDHKSSATSGDPPRSV